MPEVLADADAEAHSEAASRRRAPGCRRRRSAARRTGRSWADTTCYRRGAARRPRTARRRCRADDRADSSTKPTTRLISPAAAASSSSRGSSARMRDLRVEVLEQVAGQAQLGEHEQVDVLCTRVGDHAPMRRQVVVQHPELRRHLSEPNAHAAHGADVTRARQPPRRRPRRRLHRRPRRRRA